MGQEPVKTTGSSSGVSVESINVIETARVPDGDRDPDSSLEVVDPKLARRVLWKLDLIILPMVTSIYFLSTMGRSNLGNAKIAGLSESLQLTAHDYSNASTMFLVGYVVFQLPGTVLLKKITPPIQFFGAMLLWGVCTLAMAFVTNKASLFGLQFLIGSSEALVQGLIFYLSFWYEYHELAFRGAIMFGVSSLGGAFNGLIAYGITQHVNKVNGWEPWQLFLLIEGAMPIAFSFLIPLALPSTPSELKLGFSPVEKEYVILRASRSHNDPEARLEWKKICNVLASPHFWMFMLMACASHFCLSTFSNFIPSIIQGFGYSEVNAQLFTVIAYACACVGVLLWAWVADKTGKRGFTLALSSISAVVGYAMLVGVTGRQARFAATCLAAFSVFPNIVLLSVWMATSFVGYTRRGSALAFSNIFSQLFAVSGQQAYVDPPYYRTGNAVALALSIMSLVLSLLLRQYLKYRNKKKQETSESEGAAVLRLKSFGDIGDEHPDYMYTL